MTDDLPPNDRSIPGYEVLSNTKLSADVHQLVVRAPASPQHASPVSS